MRDKTFSVMFGTLPIAAGLVGLAALIVSGFIAYGSLWRTIALAVSMGAFIFAVGIVVLGAIYLTWDSSQE